MTDNRIIILWNKFETDLYQVYAGNVLWKLLRAILQYKCKLRAPVPWYFQKRKYKSIILHRYLYPCIIIIKLSN